MFFYIKVSERCCVL